MKYLLILSLVLFSACGKSISSTEVHATVQGEDATSYYQKFLFKTLGDCFDPFYQIAESDPRVKIGTTDEGRDILAALEIVIRADNTFDAVYTEIDVLSYLENGYTYESGESKIVSGRYYVDGSSLVLEGLGVGEAISVDKISGFSLQLGDDLVTPGLKGHSMNIMLMRSSKAPMDSLDACAS